MLVVAAREYRAAVQSKAFIMTLVAMPVLWGGSIAAQLVLREKVDTNDKCVAVLDRTGELYDAIAAAAEQRNTQDIFKGDADKRRQVKPRFVLERVDPAEAGEPPDSTVKLSDRVRQGEIFAFVEIGPEALLVDAPPGRPAIAYHSNSPTYDDLRGWLNPVVSNRIWELRATEAGMDLAAVRRVTQWVSIENLGLASREASGTITQAEQINELASFFVPLGMMMLMFIAVFVGASPLLQNVLEEKMARIAEVLLGSIQPFPLMMGKLIGTVGVSLTIVSVYMIGGYYALDHAGYSKYFPGHLIVWFILFQSLAVLMYGSIFSAIGAAVSDLKEAQSSMLPVMIIAMSPMFVWINVVKEPSATFSLALSLFPPATPMLMLMRQAVPPGVPLWQPLVGIVGVLLTTTACVYASGRIFRVGILMQGKGAHLGQMLRWVFRG
jgi:ABC-2 type transport system permease protein